MEDKSNMLPKSINKETPAPDADALSITAVTKSSGKITGYQLSDGQILSKEEGIQLAKNHKIKGVAVAEKNGSEYLRTLPDGSDSNNLGSLPTV